MLQIGLDSVTNAYNLIYQKLDTWIRDVILLIPNIITAVLVFLAFYLAARIIDMLLVRILRRTRMGEEISNILIRIVHLGILLIGFFFALGILHLDKTVTSLLAGAGIVGLALSFAFQDIMANFVSGFIIAARKPFKAGDLVETNGIQGYVSRISLRATYIRTFTGQDVIIPSKDVLQKAITNFTTCGTRRVDILVGVSYGDDLEKAAKHAREACESIEDRDASKDVEVYFESFGDSSVNMLVFFWIDLVQNKSFLKARHDAVIGIHKTFKANGITIPFPIRTLDFGIKGGEKIDFPVKTT